MKISVILPTNKKNSEEELEKMKKVCSVRDIWSPNPIFNWDFTAPLDDWVYDAEHILEPTLSCLFGQVFNDYEVLLCHKYPEDAEELLESYDGYDIKLIREKPSIWHELGDEYPTVNNNRNTGIIEARGELLLFLDDNTIFGPYLLKRAWEEYKKGYYITARAIRRIRYDPEAKPSETHSRKTLVDKDIYGVQNFNNVKSGGIIPKSATWTYCCSVSLEDTLRINGMDEIWDGNFGGTDQDFGRRLSVVSDIKRKLIGNIYEFAHKSPRQKLRNDEILRQICGQMIPKHVRANSWKPTEAEMRRYKKWHETHIGYLDPNWDRFLDVNMFNLDDIRNE